MLWHDRRNGLSGLADGRCQRLCLNASSRHARAAKARQYLRNIAARPSFLPVRYFRLTVPDPLSSNLQGSKKGAQVRAPSWVKAIWLCDVFALFLLSPAFMLRLALVMRTFRVVGDIAHSIFGLAPGILNLALHFLGATLHLAFGVTRPLSRLTLGASGHFIDFTFHTVLIHRTAFLALGRVMLYKIRVAARKQLGSVPGATSS